MKKSDHKNSKVRISLIIGFIIVLAGGVLGFNKIADHNDGLRFAEADKKKQVAFSQLIKTIGMPLAEEEKNVCYNSEQGPYDDGRLWCQTASLAFFPNEVPEQEIRSSFEALISANGWQKNSTANAKLGFEGAKGLVCNLEVRSGRLATSVPYYFSDNENSKQAILVVCIDRAKAKHYQYVN